MKVLHISESFLPRRGGAELHIHYLTRELIRDGHSVGILTSEPNVLPESEATLFDYMRIQSAERTLQGLVVWPIDLLRVLRVVRKYDFIHCHYSSRLSTLGVIAARILGLPNAVTTHGRGTLDSSVKDNVIAKIYRAASLTLAKGVIAPSREISQIANRWNTEVAYIPNGVDLENFPIESRNNSPALSFVAVRRLVPKNGVHFALAGLQNFARENPDLPIYFDICGTGYMENQLRREIQESPTPNLKVRMLGEVSHIELSSLLKLARYAIFLSTAEAVSLALLECMASGAIPIVNPIGGLGEIVEHKRNGLVLPNGAGGETRESNYDAGEVMTKDMLDGLASILSEIASGDLEEEKLRQNARRTAEDFDWNSIYTRTLDYYRYLSALK